MDARGDARPAGGGLGGTTPRRPLAHSGLKMAAVATEPMNPPAKKYGSVVITLENVLLPPEKLSPSPSQQDGLDADIEMDLRILGCELIQTGGILLRLPQVAMAAGQVLFQRFYYAKSMVRYPMETTAMACIALASKIEEAPRKIRDVINVFNHVRQVKNGKTIQPVILDSNYIALKNQVIKAERRLLKELGFCCHVKHPHKIIIMYLRLLEADDNRRLAQSSWNYMNDALRTDVFVRYSPETIACACIWLAARLLKVPLPEQPPWYLVLRVKQEHIEDVAASILRLYTRKKVKLEALETRVEEIRKEQQEARLRSKVVASIVTPQTNTAFSPASRANSPSKPASPARKRSSSPDREKGLIVRSRSRSHSRSPPRNYDKYDRYDKYEKVDRYPQKGSGGGGGGSGGGGGERYEKNDRYIREEKSSSGGSNKYENSSSKDKTDKYNKYNSTSSSAVSAATAKFDRYDVDKKKYDRDDNKKYYDNGFGKPHKAKKNGRHRSRSRDRRR
ncbi:cyclin-L2-like isoform X3 [Eriocheir sinensis]|uniref:cyclin-L2-like isoform X3 n=1 Tax=Eriocheir sinensis TaxID=95602 RepID=UPI0021C93389|nr:cyclin-L2-like isoform X3 [Eriocheir sinensis]